MRDDTFCLGFRFSVKSSPHGGLHMTTKIGTVGVRDMEEAST
ncbi:hypothetical protein ACIOD1_34770 [Streptomyces sp. NPDC088097]